MTRLPGQIEMKSEKVVLPAALALAVLVLSSVAACTEDAPPNPRGPELLAPLKKDLKEALVAGMQDGPLNAVSVCKDQAPAIAASLSVDGVEMGRTSHKLRNPANAAPGWVDPILQSYLADNADRAPAIVSLSDGREGYVEPILLQPLCVTCHGKTLPPNLAARISEEYPDDQATGFDVGDLRGVFWVEYPR
ncbi:MAG: DUF3365 domain-containing protein [Gammaproteobacteria bacterium]|nr:DUF3365 domain-containing protein [Gammaproteobacteria bacterium]